MTGSGCSHTGSLFLGSCGLDRPAGSHGSTEPSLDGRDQAAGLQAQRD